LPALKPSLLLTFANAEQAERGTGVRELRELEGNWRELGSNLEL